MLAAGGTPIKALSIRQPWAWAITTLGKDIENRTWHRRFFGPVLIHAGAGLRNADVADFLVTVTSNPELQARLDAAGGLQIERLREETGGIVGSAEITGCVRTSPSPWFFGPYGFTLAGAKPLPFRPCKGALGFFDPDATGAAVRPTIAGNQVPDPLFPGLPSWPTDRPERTPAGRLPPLGEQLSML